MLINDKDILQKIQTLKDDVQELRRDLTDAQLQLDAALGFLNVEVKRNYAQYVAGPLVTKKS